MSVETIARVEERPAWRGVLAGAVVWVAALWIWHLLREHPHAQLVAAGVACDLTLTAALAAYLFSRRPRLALTIAGLGLTLTGWAVPPARHLTALIEPALLALTIARLPTLRRVYRARTLAGDDGQTALAAGFGAALGNLTLGRAIALELAILRLAVAGWRLPRPREGFFVRLSQWRVVLVLFAFLIVVESLATHLMFLHVWRPLAFASTVTAIYSLLWLVGDYHALRLYPTTIAGGELRVRVGLRWSARVPLGEIASVARSESFPPDSPRSGARCLRATALGAPNVVVQARGVAIGPFGRRRAFTSIAFGVEDPEAFVAALAATPRT